MLSVTKDVHRGTRQGQARNATQGKAFETSRVVLDKSNPKNHFLLSRRGGLRRRLRWGVNLFSREEADMVTPYNLGRDIDEHT